MSGDVMTFPSTWEKYEETYGFNDTEQIYTNGSRLIQSFRVKQWLEHIEVSEDCISRADLIESFLADSECKREEAKACMCSIDFMLELIETAPSVIPTTEKSSMIGEWIDENGNHVPFDNDGNPSRSCWCKKCGEWLVGSDEYPVKGNYCPNCGKKMKGTNNETI